MRTACGKAEVDQRGSAKVDWFEAERQLRVDLDAVAKPVVTFEPLAPEANGSVPKLDRRVG